MVFFVGSSRFSRGWSSDGWPRDASWNRSGFSSRRPSRHPLHGRNDMKTSENRFSRQKHAHKQRKQGLSCHHAPPQSPQPPQEPRTPSIVSTVFNSPKGPVGPKRPKDGCLPSISVSQSPNFPRRTQKKLRKNFANCNYCVSLELGRVVRERP